MIVLASINGRQYWRGTVYSMCAGSMVGRTSGISGNLEILAPTYALVGGHKRGKGDTRYPQYQPLTDQQYIDGYRRLLASRWSEVKQWLLDLQPDTDVTLLCWCSEGKFCHRQLVAQMLARWRPDIEVALH